ncbi:MAG: PilZ domain-containing protein [Ancalomicrobiaceae bacterium]|nr:PilZ domain-containing protein [Ancalomicrobiaceae bacterium]
MFGADASKQREKRRWPRQKVLIPAYFNLPRRDLRLQQCILKDVSITGCQVVGRQVEIIDGNFVLHSDVFEEPRLCTIAWRSRHVIGARFIEAPDAEPSELEPTQPAITSAARDASADP